MTRYLATLATFAAWLFTPAAWAQSEPDWCKEGYLCIDDQTAQKVRDKARGFSLLCSELNPPTSLPEGLATLCEYPGQASRIWARAEKARQAQATADEMQRKANLREGRVQELRKLNGRLVVKVGKMAGERDVARQSLQTWRIVGLSAGGLAALSTVVWVGHLAGAWVLPPP